MFDRLPADALSAGGSWIRTIGPAVKGTAGKKLAGATPITGFGRLLREHRKRLKLYGLIATKGGSDDQGAAPQCLS
jgi:hypothetical protein